MSTPQTTHWDGCATEGGPAHYWCAVGRICDLKAELAQARTERDDHARDMLRLLATIKYLRGIAVRGEGREARDDETVEAFVLGYVKRIEAERDKYHDALIARHGGEPIALLSELDEARAERDALRADAERLEWLDAHPREGGIRIGGDIKSVVFWGVSAAPGTGLRSAIDAARAEG